MGAWWPPRSSKPLRPDYSGWVGSIPTRSRYFIKNKHLEALLEDYFLGFVSTDFFKFTALVADWWHKFQNLLFQYNNPGEIEQTF